MSHLRNLQSNIKFKLAGEGFFFPLSKSKPQNLATPITGITDTNLGVKKKKPKTAKNATIKQTFSTLGDMLLQKYAVEFIATLKGDKVVITGGELGEWRLTHYTSGTIYSQLKLSASGLYEGPISIEHNCGPDPKTGPAGEDLVDKKWVWAMTPGEDRRRRLCNHCKKRVPETIKGLIKLIE